MESLLWQASGSHVKAITAALSKVGNDKKAIDVYKFGYANCEPLLEQVPWVKASYHQVDDDMFIASININSIREFNLIGKLAEVRLEALRLINDFATRRSVNYEKKLVISLRRLIKELIGCTFNDQYALDCGFDGNGMHRVTKDIDRRRVDLIESIEDFYVTLESVIGMTLSTEDSCLACGSPFRSLGFVVLSSAKTPPLCSLSRRDSNLKVAVPVKSKDIYDAIQFSSNGGASYCGHVPAGAICQFMEGN